MTVYVIIVYLFAILSIKRVDDNYDVLRHNFNFYWRHNFNLLHNYGL